MAIKNPAGKRVYGAFFTRHVSQGLIKVLDGRIELDSAVKEPSIMEMEQGPPSKL